MFWNLVCGPQVRRVLRSLAGICLLGTRNLIVGGERVSVESRQVLIAAQEKARHVLSESSARAKRLVSDSDSEAVALLLEQQEVAEGLLLSECEGSAGGSSAVKDSR